MIEPVDLTRAGGIDLTQFVRNAVGHGPSCTGRVDMMEKGARKLSAARLKKYAVLIDLFDAYLEQNWSKPLYNDACARELGMSPRSLSTVVTMMRGMSVQQYIRHRRLAAVRHAINNNENRRCIGRIAKAYGFQHLGEFAREYKRQYGERPSETTAHEGEPASAIEPSVDLDGWSPRTATDIKGTGAGA